MQTPDNHIPVSSVSKTSQLSLQFSCKPTACRRFKFKNDGSIKLPSWKVHYDDLLWELYHCWWANRGTTIKDISCLWDSRSVIRYQVYGQTIKCLTYLHSQMKFQECKEQTTVSSTSWENTEQLYFAVGLWLNWCMSIVLFLHHKRYPYILPWLGRGVF